MNLCARSKLIWVAILVGSLDWSAIAVRAGSAKTPSAIGSEPQQQPSAKVPVLDTLIVPGKRAGAITSKTTSNDLTNIFGKQRLTPKKFYGAEGQVELPATLITFGKNRSVTVVWKNAKKQQPFQVMIHDPTWKTASGIGLGTSLTKLRQILGEFKITGLGWDYGNQVVDLSSAIQARYTGLSIAVDADRAAAKQFPADLHAVSGDGVTPVASDPRWKRLKMHVSHLTVSFPDRSPTVGK